MDTERFGETETVDLKHNGRHIAVTDENKLEYVQLICQEKLTGSIRSQVHLYIYKRLKSMPILEKCDNFGKTFI